MKTIYLEQFEEHPDEELSSVEYVVGNLCDDDHGENSLIIVEKTYLSTRINRVKMTMRCCVCNSHYHITMTEGSK